MEPIMLVISQWVGKNCECLVAKKTEARAASWTKRISDIFSVEWGAQIFELEKALKRRVLYILFESAEYHMKDPWIATNTDSPIR
jgi:hypothetical protein